MEIPTQIEPDSRYITDDGPIPLSFPAIIRNPGLTDRYAHLRSQERLPSTPKVIVKKNRREDKEGKRWIRRRENAHFTGNPHIVVATKNDHLVPLPSARTTFPEPLPPYLPRNSKVPTAVSPIRDPNSANAGRFSLSMKGMRRELRKSGSRTENLVQDVEYEIMHWLYEGGTVLSPDTNDTGALQSPGIPIGTTATIMEISRSPQQLIWSITDDSFGRYIVHCCARFHEIVSFSKEVSGRRLTYLLRPNVALPDFRAAAGLDTPPTTDIDYSSHFDNESSDPDARSEAAESDFEPQVRMIDALSSITEDPPSTSPRVHPLPNPALLDDEDWSVIGDMDADESGSDDGITSLTNISLQVNRDHTPRVGPRIRQSLHPRTWNHRQGRSASSPSRSPARRPSWRVFSRADPPRSQRLSKSFYDYLFT